MTFSLFYNLQNPLFKKYWDAKEFVHAVGPALENFHDTLARLRNELPEDLEEELSSILNKSEEEFIEEIKSKEEKDVRMSIFGENHWRTQAEADPDSLAGRLAKMTTDVCLDAFFYTSKLDIIGRASLGGENAAGFGLNDYVPGSCKVNEVALLSARAMVMDEKEDKIDVEHPEFAASEGDLSPKEGNVAAQIDVLYEVTHTYKISDPAAAAAYEVIMDTAGEGTPEATTTTDSTKKDDSEASENIDAKESAGETVSYTNLAVAVFEGWLHRESKDEGLRWKIALLREAHEFPENQPTIVRNAAS